MGVRAQEHFGRGRLNALYTNLSSDTPPASWPETYGEALTDDFFGQRIDAAILPVAHWLRRRSGQTGSDRHFAEMAYGMMIARRDFEQGCARYELSGTECTPERLAEEEAWHLESIARIHAVEYRVDLRLLEIARLAREEAEANHARERAERALLQAEALEAALAREAELAAERAAEEAEAAAARVEAARESLAALQAEHELAPPPALPASAVNAAIVDTEIGDNRTLYRIRLTNTSSEAIFGLAVDARMRTPAADSGVAITSGGGLRALEPGESMEVSLVGDGALDAVRLYITGAGQLLGSFDYPMLHESAAPDEEAVSSPQQGPPQGWIDLPAEFRGTTQIEQFGGREAQGRLQYSVTCISALRIDRQGVALWSLDEPCQWRPGRYWGVRNEVIYISDAAEVDASVYRFTIPIVEGRIAIEALEGRISEFQPVMFEFDKRSHSFESIEVRTDHVQWSHVYIQGSSGNPYRVWRTHQRMERIR